MEYFVAIKKNADFAYICAWIKVNKTIPMKHSILKLFVLPLVFVLVTMAGQLKAQSTYSSAIYLCNSAGVYNLNTSNSALEAGPDYGCLPNTPGLRRNAHWFRFQVGTSGNLSLMPTPTVNVNLNYVVWGPFNDPDPGVAALTSANIAACDASPALVSALQMTGLLANQYYIICLTSEEGLAGTFNFVPQTGNSMVFGSSIRPLGAPSNPSSIVACSPSFFIQTWPALNNISGVQFSGPGVDPITGEFNPILASSSANGGFGLKTITITGNPYGCAPRSATYSINVTPCPSYPCVQNPSNTSTLCWNSFVPPLNAGCFNISLLPGGVTLASYQWEVQYQNTTTWVNVGSGPSLNALIATNSMNIRVVAVLSNGVRVPSNEVFFTVLPPIQRSQLSVQGGGRDTVCYEGNLTIIASPTNGGGNQFSYQWERRIGAGAWNNFGTPTTSTSLPLNGLVATASYRLKATDISVNNCGTIYSDEMTVTVLNPVTPGTIQPASQNLCLDNTVSFNVSASASGSGAPSYQWEYSVDQNSWVPITGATSATYSGGAETISGTGLAAPGTRFYRRRIAYQAGTVICPSTALYSNVVTVTWIDDLPYVAFSSTETFSGPFSHPWPNTSGIISNPTSGGIALTTSGTTAGNNGTSHYRLPASIVPSDGIITFTFNASWIVGGSNVSSAPTGVTNLLAAFEINGVPFSLLNGGSTYALKVSAGNSIGFSIGFLNQNATGTVQFRGTISNFKFYPKSSSGSSIYCSLDQQALTPIVAPASGVTYLWSTSNGAGAFIPANNVANATYVPTAADNGRTIILNLVATRLSGECANRNTSATYSITYRTPFVRANVLNTSADTVCYAGIPGALVATAASGGSGPYTYQWQYREDGTTAWVNIPGATQLTYNIPTALLASRFYRILSTDAGLPACGIGTSSEIKITVLNPLTAPTFPGTSSPSLTTVSGFPYLTARICPNTTQTLTPTASSGGNNSFCYTWQAVDFSAVNPNLLNQPHLWPWVDVRVCSSLISFTTPSMPVGSKRFYRVIGEDQPVMTPIGCGSPWSLPVLVEAFDTTAPVINVISNIRFYVNANCSTTVSNPAALNNGSTDNCPGALVNWTLTPNSFTGTGTRQAVLTASDLSGNVGSRNITLTLLDTFRPVALAKNLTVYLDAAGNASIQATDVNNGSSDNCTAALVLSPSVFNFNCSNVTNLVPLTRTLTVTDASGNSNSANFTVHVRDTSKPVLTSSTNILYLNPTGTGVVNSSSLINATDNCCISSYVPASFSFNCSNIGINSRGIRVSDCNGNSDSITITVVVADTIKPVLAITSSVTLLLDNNGSASISAAQIDLGTTDNCQVAARTLSKTNFDCTNLGVNPVEFRAMDPAGNMSSAIVLITIEDRINPTVTQVASSQLRNVYLNNAGFASVNTSNVVVTADNCRVDSIIPSTLTFTCNDMTNYSPVINGGTVFRSVSVKDQSGNQGSSVVQFVVFDTIKPIAIPPLSKTIYLNAAGQWSDSAFRLFTAFDNCCILGTTPAIITYNCSNIGTRNETIVLNDCYGNSSSITISVTILDTIAPSLVVNPGSLTVYLNSSGSAVLSPISVNNGSTDACGAPVRNFTLSKSTFDCSNIGSNNVLFCADDAFANRRCTSLVVNVLDTIKPSAVPASNVVAFLNNTGSVTVQSSSLINNYSDNCGGVPTYNPASFTFVCNDAGSTPGGGINSRSLTITDGSGNSITLSVIITVRDTIKPIASPIPGSPYVRYLNASGLLTLSSANFLTGISDNCGNPVSISPQNLNFTCGDAASNTVTRTVTLTDTKGNTSPISLSFSILDTIKPIATQNSVNQVYLNSSGSVTVSSSSLISANDACAPLTYVPSSLTYNCTQTGLRTNTVRVSDANQNSTDVVLSINVSDTVKPVVTPIPTTIYMNSMGMVSVQSSSLVNASDACGPLTYNPQSYSFDCNLFLDSTAIQRSVTVSDSKGNSSSVSVTITLLDTISRPRNIRISLDSVPTCYGKDSTFVANVWFAPTTLTKVGSVSLRLAFDTARFVFMGLNHIPLSNDSVVYNGNGIIKASRFSTSGFKFCPNSNPLFGVRLRVKKSNWHPYWSGGISYNINDTVTHNNQIWVANSNIPAGSSEPSATTSNWALYSFNPSTIISFASQQPEDNQVSDMTGIVLPFTFTNSSPITIKNCNTITGKLWYRNSQRTPLANRTLNLIDPSGVVRRSAIIRPNGDFVFSTVDKDVDTLAWGQNFSLRINQWDIFGVNAVDALLVQKHAIDQLTLPDTLQKMAGNVNCDNSLNGTDALRIHQVFITNGTFNNQNTANTPCASLIRMSKESINVKRGTISLDTVLSLSVGDVNGSRSLNISAPRYSVPLLSGNIYKESGVTYIPVSLDATTTLGAFSMVLKLPYNTKVSDIRFQDRSNEELLWNQIGDDLRISWSSLKSLDFVKGSSLFIIEASTFGSGGNILVGSETEFGDASGNILGHINPVLPRIPQNGSNFSVGVYPNPSNGLVVIKGEYISVNIQDVSGRLILESEMTKVGKELDLTSFADGVYTLNITTPMGVETHRLVIKK